MRKYSSECPDTFVYCWSRNNGEWYYGVHTGSLDDGYIGSGTKFRNKFDNTDRSEWRRTIVFRGSRQECLSFERDLVSLTMVDKPDCLNLMEGGRGGVQSQEVESRRVAAMKGIPKSKKHREKLSLARLGRGDSEEEREAKRLGQLGRKHSEESRVKRSKALTGRVFSEEHRKNLSLAMRKRHEKP